MNFDAFSPAALAAVAGLFGLLVGSFLNVVIHRLPIMMQREWQSQCAELRGETLAEQPALNLWVPRSRCPACGHTITALENIPVLSYLVLRGRCSACQAPISPRYPLVELCAGALCTAATWHWGASAAALGAIVLLLSLLTLALIDADTQLLPDDITLPLLWAGLGFNLFGTFATLSSAVIGAMAGYLSLWSVYWGFRLLTGKEGMGYGDFKLLAALGAWMGWQLLPVIVLLSSVVGAVIGVILMVLGRHGRGTPLPFGPYLAAAGVIALFAGHEINSRYLGML